MEKIRQTFRKKERIRKSSEFGEIFNKGFKINLKNFLIIKNPNDLNLRRLGISVSKKVGRAVKRNKIKRWIREFFRTHKSLIPPIDLLIIVKKGSEPLKDYSQICEELKILLKQEVKDCSL